MTSDPADEFDLPQFERILETSKCERDVAEFLKRYPRALYWTLCAASGHDRYLFTEFPFGSRFRADVVILNSYSGAWEVFFIELEPVADPIFTKKGVPSKRLAGAVKQLDDWREYMDRYKSPVRADLVNWAKKRDRLGYSSLSEPCNYSGDRLADENTALLANYFVMIGRSSRMSEVQRQLMGRYSAGHAARIVTYDRIHEMALRRYGCKKSSRLAEWNDVP